MPSPLAADARRRCATPGPTCSAACARCGPHGLRAARRVPAAPGGRGLPAAADPGHPADAVQRRADAAPAVRHRRPAVRRHPRGPGGAPGVTVNDVVLGLVAESLRRHLSEIDRLPDEGAGGRRTRVRPTRPATSGSTATRCRTCSRRCAPTSRTRSSDSRRSTRSPPPPRGSTTCSAPTCSPTGASCSRRSPTPGSCGSTAGSTLADRHNPPINLVVSNVPGPREPALHRRRRAGGDLLRRPGRRGRRPQRHGVELPGRRARGGDRLPRALVGPPRRHRRHGRRAGRAGRAERVRPRSLRRARRSRTTRGCPRGRSRRAAAAVVLVARLTERAWPRAERRRGRRRRRRRSRGTPPTWPGWVGQSGFGRWLPNITPPPVGHSISACTTTEASSGSRWISFSVKPIALSQAMPASASVKVRVGPDSDGHGLSDGPARRGPRLERTGAPRPSRWTAGSPRAAPTPG